MTDQDNLPENNGVLPTEAFLINTVEVVTIANSIELINAVTRRVVKSLCPETELVSDVERIETIGLLLQTELKEEVNPDVSR